MKLGSGVVVAGSCSFDLNPGLGTSTCRRCRPLPLKKKSQVIIVELLNLKNILVLRCTVLIIIIIKKIPQLESSCRGSVVSEPD